MSRTKLGLTTPTEEIAAVRSKNEFLEVPIRLAFEYRTLKLKENTRYITKLS
jgi:hypothetical protein